MERRLAAILAVDVVGYGGLIERDEAGTLAALRERRRQILDPLATRHRGRVVKVMGDGVLVEFTSAVNAVTCAVELQERFAAANEGLTEDRSIALRAGVNLGDVAVESGDLYGEGVIIAVRLQAMAEPGGICVSGSVHEQVAGKLPTGFEDLGLCEVKNSSRPVRVFQVRTTGREPMQTAAPSGQTLPSIAVLPFDNMSGDAGQEYLSDGITEDIITELSRFRNISVAARHSSFRYGGKNANPAQVARDLGVNFIVEGSVRKAGGRVRITAQLIDAKTGNHVWAERFDRQSSDIFAVQDEVVSVIVTTLEGRMTAAAAVLARKKPTTSWSAYDFLLQGLELSNANKEKEAVPLFARAVAIDPKFARAHALLAIGLLATYWFDAQTQTLNEAALAAQRALALDSNDSTIHHANAMVMLWLRQYERAGMHFDRAIALNPGDIQIRADRANWLRYTGRPEEALAAVDDALKRTPFPPLWFWQSRGAILLQLKRYREAIDSFHNVPEKDHLAYAQLAAAYSYLGDTANAARALANARELRPSLSLREVTTVVPHGEKQALDHLLDGLRKAGMPE